MFITGVPQRPAPPPRGAGAAGRITGVTLHTGLYDRSDFTHEVVTDLGAHITGAPQKPAPPPRGAGAAGRGGT